MEYIGKRCKYFGKILKTDKYLDDTEKKCINPIFFSG